MDRWLFWPVFTSLTIVTALALLCGFPGRLNLIVEAISVLVCVIACIALLGVALISAIKKRPRRASSFLLAMIVPVLLWWPINWVADCVHLGITIGFGAGQLGASSSSDGSRFVAYDWSTGFAGSNKLLIHDETNEIALPVAQHTHPLASEIGLGEDCAGNVGHLLGHYYICEF